MTQDVDCYDIVPVMRVFSTVFIKSKSSVVHGQTFESEQKTVNKLGRIRFNRRNERGQWLDVARGLAG